jgi:hypothetical protein
MTDVHQKKEVKNTLTVDPIVAGIAGVVAGGIAVAAAVALSDKGNQKKIKDTLVEAKDNVISYIDTATSKPVMEKNAHSVEKLVTDVKAKIGKI